MTEDELPPELKEYESPLPECRVTATADPFGAVRVDLSHHHAAAIAKRTIDTLDGHSDGLVPIYVGMERDAYATLSQNLAAILETEAEAIQVVADADPDVSLFVILNKSQIQSLDETTDKHLDMPQRQFMWRFSVSEDGARLLKEQIIAALHGADEPLEVAKENADA